MSQVLTNNIQKSQCLGSALAAALVLTGSLGDVFLVPATNSAGKPVENEVRKKTATDFEYLQKAEEKRERKRLKRLELL